MKHKHDPKKLFLQTYNNENWSEMEESSDITRKEKVIKKNRLMKNLLI